MEDVDFINYDGKTMNKLLLEANPHMTLFPDNSRVADKLAVDLKGRIKLEDVGFDWKVIGPDVQEVDYVAWVCDGDAYACSGQKCSAQSLLFMHEESFGSIRTVRSFAEEDYEIESYSDQVHETLSLGLKHVVGYAVVLQIYLNALFNILA